LQVAKKIKETGESRGGKMKYCFPDERKKGYNPSTAPTSLDKTGIPGGMQRYPEHQGRGERSRDLSQEHGSV